MTTRKRRGGKADLADLYLLGIGIRGFRQVSLETMDVLRRCRKIIHLTNVHRELRKLNPNVVDWGEHYWTDEDFDNVYERLYRQLLDDVAEGPGVASVIYGHPLFFDDVHMRLLRVARRRGFRCVALPGISSLDTLSTDLGVDYAEGLQVFEAADLVVNRIPVNPHLHTLVFQVGCFALETPASEGEEQRAALRELQDHLLRYHPPRQRIVLAASDDGGGDGRTLLRSQLGKLASHHRRMSFGTTMYIAPVPR